MRTLLGMLRVLLSRYATVRLAFFGASGSRAPWRSHASHGRTAATFRKEDSAAFVSQLLLSVTLALAGCAPNAYKAPAEQFLAGTKSLREVYFAEWDIANRARIQRADLDDQVVIWAAPPGVANSAEINRLRERMAKRRVEDIHDQLRPLREQAFSALEGYANAILGLASDEPTESLITGLNGLAGDIQSTVKAFEKLKLAGDVASKGAAFLGPLQGYVKVLTEIVKGVSAIAREAAIRETIGRSNEPITEILNVLKAEAILAKARAESEMREARGRADSFARNPAFATIAVNVKTELAREGAAVDALAERHASVDIEGAFSAALRAQRALVEAAVVGNVQDLLERMIRFKVQVEKVRQAVNEIREPI